MKYKYYLLILLSLLTSCCFSQTGATTNNKKNFITVYPSIGYVWQGYNNPEAGIILKYKFKQTQKSINYTLGCNVFNHNVTYCSPNMSLGYSGILKNTTWGGWNISLVYSWIKINKQIDQLMTPEIGLRIWGLTFSYGYNMYLDKSDIYFISHHRFAIRLTHP